MNKKIKILIAAIGIVMISRVSVNATTINYKFNINEKYKILLDGQSYEIPDQVEYSADDEVPLSTFKSNIESFDASLSSITYTDSVLKYEGGVIFSKVTNERVPLITEYGLKNSAVTTKELINNFETWQLLSIREQEKAAYEKAIEGTTAEDALKEYNFRVKNYASDIARIESEKLSSSSKTIVSSIPYLYEKMAYNRDEDEIDYDNDTLTSKMTINYYLYSIIFRDLRIVDITYTVDSGEETVIADFDKDTYTYTVKLPASIADDATITTSSIGYMDYVLDDDSYDLGLEIQDATVQLKNGMATVQVKNVFKVYETYGSYLDEDYTSDPQRTYTINFSKYVKGDLDRNGVVNGNDSAVALDLYKYENATEEDIEIGDIDENGVINANDAALILDIYKYGN